MISKVIITGDAKKAIKDADAIKQAGFDVYPNVLDAINFASINPDSIVVISAQSFSDRLLSIIKALKSHSSAKVILLIQMHQELYIRRIQASSNGKMLIDDYIICPITVNFLKIRIQQLISPESYYPQQIYNGRPPDLSELERLAVTDDLTGLKNRRYLFEFLRQIIEYAGNFDSRVTLLLFDVDDLKKYNDTYGHLAGDELLKKTAQLICRCCRPKDIVGRIGGDEFAVIFWDDPNAAGSKPAKERRSHSSSHPREVIAIANRFRRELEKADMSFFAKDHGVITISGGLATFPQDGSSAFALMSQADSALLEAKRNGKNRINLVGKSGSSISGL